MSLSHRAALTVSSVLLAPSCAQAGMPSIRFSDVAALRLESISFFLMLLLASAGGVWWLWNWLSRDFGWLPRITYPKACGVVALWGLLFVIVLAMISGARELMTPGAWEREGFTYKLQEKEHAEDENLPDRAARQHRLQLLWQLLAVHAGNNHGTFPSHDGFEHMAGELAKLPTAAALAYRYVEGRSLKGEPQLLLYEPFASGEATLGLFTTGEIRVVDGNGLRALLPNEQSL